MTQDEAAAISRQKCSEIMTSDVTTATRDTSIRDVAVLVDLMVGIGAKVEGIGTSTLRVRCETITGDRPDPIRPDSSRCQA